MYGPSASNGWRERELGVAASDGIPGLGGEARKGGVARRRRWVWIWEQGVGGEGVRRVLVRRGWFIFSFSFSFFSVFYGDGRQGWPRWT